MNVTHVPARTRKGTVLLTALVTLMFVSAIGMAILSLTLHGLHMTRRTQGKMVAFNLAESGMDRAIRWLQDQPSPPDTLNYFDPFGGDQQLGAGTYSVVIVPDPLNFNTSQKEFKIVATGVSGLETDVVELVVRQSSFGKYAYFTDRETSSVSGGRIWFYSGDRIRGPAHSNNENGSNFQIYWGQEPGPIFEGPVTAAGPYFNFRPRDPSSEAEFLEIFEAGSRGYELGVDRVPLPSSSDMQQMAAWGAGGAYATARDLVSFAHRAFEGGLLSPPSIQQMTTIPEDQTVQYGLGWVVSNHGAEPLYRHDGGNNGFVTTLDYYPDRKLSIVILSNFGFAPLRDIREKVAESVLGAAQ